MKTEMSPVTTIAIIAVVVLAVAAWGWKQMQPVPYVPSPGVAGRPADGGVPGAVTLPDGRPSPMPPAGNIPGQVPQ